MKMALPSSRKTIKENRGYQRVYHVHSSQRINGRPTSNEICIGKLDETDNCLIPNLMYFDIYQDEFTLLLEYIKTLPDGIEKTKLSAYVKTKNINSHHIVASNNGTLKTYSLGSVILFDKVADESGLIDMLREVFPEDYDKILRIAYYFASEETVLSRIRNWHVPSTFNLGNPIDDRRASELFYSLTLSKREEFLEKWIKKFCNDDYIVYDVTSIQTYSEKNTKAKFGYHGKHINIPQINIGMFFAQNQHLPLYYHAYDGSIPDKADFKFVLDRASSLGLKNLSLVLDRGFYTNDNILKLKNLDYEYIIPVPKSRILYRQLLDRHKHEIERPSNRFVGQSGKFVFGKAFPTEISGNRVVAHIFFNTERCSIEKNEIFFKIEDNMKLLEENKKTKSIAISRSLKQYHSITMAGSSKEPCILEFSEDEDKILYAMENCGYLIFITSNPSLSSNLVYNIYGVRHKVEKSFGMLKNNEELERLRTKNTITTEGEIFVGFIAHIVRTLLFNKIKQYDKIRKNSLKTLIKELNNLYLYCQDDTSYLNTMTKEQKACFAACGLDIEDSIIKRFSKTT
jgi:transposase